MQIALLEDDSATARLLTTWMEAAGYRVFVYDRGKALLAALQRDSFDLLVLDWVLPDVNGDEVLKIIRAQYGWSTPVIFITSKGEPEDIVAGLEVGADDYLIKPVNSSELLARIKAVLRRLRPDETVEQLLRAPFVVDLRSRVIARDGVNISLTQREFDLAAFLFRHPGQLLSRAHILESVWGRNSSVTTRTVDIHISRLRKKLQLTDNSAWRLSGVYNYGYRLEHAADTSSVLPADDPGSAALAT